MPIGDITPIGDCENFYSECNKKCTNADNKSYCYQVCSVLYCKCIYRNNNEFFSTQLSKQVDPAAQGASTSSTFTLTGKQDNTILGTLIVSMGFAGYTVSTGTGNGS